MQRLVHRSHRFLQLPYVSESLAQAMLSEVFNLKLCNMLLLYQVLYMVRYSSWRGVKCVGRAFSLLLALKGAYSSISVILVSRNPSCLALLVKLVDMRK